MLANQTDYDRLAEMGQGVHALSVFQGFTKNEGITYWYDQNFNNETEWKMLMNNNMKESFFDFSAYYAIELTPDNALAPKWQLVQDMVKTDWIRAVMSPTEQQCVDIYNALVKKANDAGLKDVEKFYSTNYRAILDSWK
jgi:putative aldouronate transport system substrate-binding protein